MLFTGLFLYWTYRPAKAQGEPVPAAALLVPTGELAEA
jgi:hypothetical protein